MKWLRKWMSMEPEYQKKINDFPVIEDDSVSLTLDIEQNETMLKNIFHNCSDIVYRKIRLNGQTQWLVVYIESLVDKQNLEDHVLKPLLFARSSDSDLIPEEIEALDDRMISIGITNTTSKLNDLVRYMLDGHVAVLTFGENKALTFAVNINVHRSLEEPPSEPVIRGSRDGFIENISINIKLLRGRLKTSRLKMEYITLGELSQTRVVITYIEGIAADSVVEEVRKRVSGIQVDGVLDSGYIEEFIEDFPLTVFPQIQSTERPDVVAACLLEGRAAILVDSSPFALIVPMTFWSGMQASEDYYIRWPVATFIRWIRFVFVFIAIFAPSLYVAVTTFHQEMIPTSLVMSIGAAREPVPFPALVEALLMEIIFEALKEAGIRLPKQIGQAISIVGALVIGQAAVQAGIISAPVVIVVSTTGIAGFTIPRFNVANGIRLLRFPMIILAGTLGLYGIVLGFLGIALHLTALRSFGVPYLSPVAPITLKDLKDVLIRAPIWAQSLRPRTFGSMQSIRLSKGQRPSPSHGSQPIGNNEDTE
ncbi:spore germination protein [Paenibacillus andongensis]|uniref:spore germination protein n=1 Tax=Paenibacillus andongensis TaxID=2975482 RepID=UPI0021BAF296|nr:spore germination protein [Paenibacillus andongensis]